MQECNATVFMEELKRATYKRVQPSGNKKKRFGF